MPRGQKSKLNACRRRRRARNGAQASEGAQETVEAADQSSPESCRTFNMPEKESIFNIPLDALSFNITDESSIGNLYDDDDLFGDYPLSSRQQDVLARKVFVLCQLLLDNYKIKQLTTMEDMMAVIDKEEINDFPEILRKTAERLADIYAVEVREVESSRKVYDLISKLKLPNNGRVRPGKGLPKTGFLTTVLGMILMNGYFVDEEDMWRMLRSMGVYPGKKHLIYGEPRKLITQDLVKLKYLEYQQVANSDPPCYKFLWCPKAYAETSEMSVLKFVAKINKISYSYFKDHYEAALKEEQRKNQSSQEVSPKTSKTSLLSMEICPLFTPLPKFRDILFSRK
ncbi:melanoma-associated antigen B5-like [Microtus ochrogaster]|uniref:Melanoma-associated antigen B5-like n=1 Tax=Microtus ochrogaster TaxID=79684 RepID=A0ABM0LLR2_MICOH|nr:melanoma-associated antigen B5-like [Microtus ochrogaster]